MNKQIILEQCDKIKNVVTEATQNEEEARNNAEKFKGIKEENTKLLDLLNKTNKKLKEIGFKYVTLDMAGYEMGSMNK